MRSGSFCANPTKPCMMIDQSSPVLFSIVVKVALGASWSMAVLRAEAGASTEAGTRETAAASGPSGLISVARRQLPALPDLHDLHALAIALGRIDRRHQFHRRIVHRLEGQAEGAPV